MKLIPSEIAGTFGDREGLHNETQCSPCTGGTYCDADGLSAPAGLCSPGFYCVQVSCSKT